MRYLISTLTIFLAAVAAWAQNPVAPEAAQVIEGNARFTILTDRLVRLEWAADGRFEDHATLAIVNRDLPVPDFSVTRTRGKVTYYYGDDF